MTAIWAYSTNAPGKTCPDARLLGGGTTIQYPAGNDTGQAGWDIGLMFNGVGDLGEKLQSLTADKGYVITRLAVNLHGSPGRIDVDSVGTEAGSYDFKRLWERKSSQLLQINGLLGSGAVVLIMGCNSARGEEGAALLKQLSSEVFKNHKVVGFTTVGMTLRQFRHGEFCSEPGMRDSDYENSSVDMPRLQEQREKEVLALPWASETSPHAKIALNGVIISGAEPPVPTTDYNPDVYLPGTWSVEIGPWKGYFVFSNKRTVFWMEETLGFRHPGKWSVYDGGLYWSFDDDPRDWKRDWEVILPLKSSVSGNVTIKGVPHGFFKMLKQV
jgi:hypothetical protein